MQSVSALPHTPSKTADQSTVFIVDDDIGVRQMLALLLNDVGVATASFASADELLAKIAPDTAGCVVLDVRMPRISGLEAHEALKALGAHVPVIFLTAHGDIEMAVRALKEGAADFLQKPVKPQAFIECIQHALLQDADNRRRRGCRAVINARLKTLTPREREVLMLVVEGAANKCIALDLGISERTVEIHRGRVMKKLGARSIAQLVKMHLEATATV
jgi:two-component system, LuxR family, response regulator FixJ